MRRYVGLIIAIGLLSSMARADDQPSRWLWLLPGGGQLYLGEKSEGAIYLGSTLSLVGWGAYAETQRGHNEVNAPLVWAQQLYVLSYYTAYRDLRIHIGDTGGAVPVDPASTKELILAPFRWKQVSSPWVIGPALVGVGLSLGIAFSRSDRRTFREIGQVHYIGQSFNRDQSIAPMTAYWATTSLGAGLSEEALFRGVIQAEAEDHWGPTKGLLFGSGVFGLVHLFNRWDPGDVAFATAAGIYLGWRYQKTNYRLSQSIAAHFWYDLAAGLTSYFVDPKHNPLGANISYTF